MNVNKTHNTVFENKLLMIGFGSIGQAILPLLFRHLGISCEQIHIISKDENGHDVAEAFSVTVQQKELTPTNYRTVLDNLLNAGDFLLNLSVNVASIELVRLCQEKNVLYLDTSTEPWAGAYTDTNLTAANRTNYALREQMLAVDKRRATALITHGANPGLVSHFVKQALVQMAEDAHLNYKTPKTQQQWAQLAADLSIRVIHIAERDSQVSNKAKKADEFVCTWSAEGLWSESMQPAELGWGSHEKHWPADACAHDYGQQSAIFLNRPGAGTKVRTWTPTFGAFHGYLITHAESISMAQYFTLKHDETLIYRPTVHYAYCPCPDAIVSLQESVDKEMHPLAENRILMNEITEGMDELGVLLMGHERGAYWYGSQLTIERARELAPYNNATSLQVAAGVLAGIIWVIENPSRGIVEPEEVDFKRIIEIASPYLGTLSGYYTSWTPFAGRGDLFPEDVDQSDPWQFKNFRVT